MEKTRQDMETGGGGVHTTDVGDGQVLMQSSPIHKDKIATHQNLLNCSAAL